MIKIMLIRTLMLVVTMATCLGVAALRLETIFIEDQVLLGHEIGLDSLTNILSNRWLEKAETLKQIGRNSNSKEHCKNLFELANKIILQSIALKKTLESNEIMGIMNQVEILTTEANHYLHGLISKQDRESVANFLHIMTYSQTLLEAVKARELTLLYVFFTSCSTVIDELNEHGYAQASSIYLQFAKSLCTRASANGEQYNHKQSTASEIYYMCYGRRLFKQMFKELIWILLSFYESSWLLYEYNETATATATAAVPHLQLPSTAREAYSITEKVILHPIRLEGLVIVSSRGLYLLTVDCSAYAYAVKVDGMLHLDQAPIAVPTADKGKGRVHRDELQSQATLQANECLIDFTNKTQATIVMYIVNPFTTVNTSQVKMTVEKVGDDGHYFRSSSRRKEVKLAHKPLRESKSSSIG